MLNTTTSSKKDTLNFLVVSQGNTRRGTPMRNSQLLAATILYPGKRHRKALRGVHGQDYYDYYDD